MSEYIQVAEEEGDEPMEIPVEDDGTLLLTTLSAQFPGSCGLRFRNPQSGAFRGVRVHEGRLYPPDSENGWMDTPFVAVFPKHPTTTDSSGDNKRKGDQTADIPIPKTKKLENIKCTDLIVLGLNYETTDETMREYFSQFGRTVLCEIKKRQDTQKSRGFGFVKFSDYAIQRQVSGQRHEIDGRMCDVKIPASKENDERSRRVFVGRVPETMKSDDLKTYFSQFGDVNDVFMPKPYRPFAFVTFEDPEVAQSLCGEDHTVCEVSLLVRSAAPRQGERNMDRFSHAGHNDQRRVDSRFSDRFPAPPPNNAMSMASSHTPMSNQTAANYATANAYQMNPQAFLAAALTQAAQQAAQAAQNQNTWQQSQQAQAAQPMNADTQVNAAAIQSIISSTAAAAAANPAWASMKPADSTQQAAAMLRSQQQAQWDATTRADGTWS